MKTLHRVFSTSVIAIMLFAAPAFAFPAYAKISTEEINQQRLEVRAELIDVLQAHVRLLQMLVINKLEARVEALQLLVDAQNK